jgi:drug/metabolite transporter (DMT)-like permease
LLGVAAVWGAAFVVVDQAIEIYPMYAFLAWRFAVAAFAFVALFPRVLKRIDRANLKMGSVAGLLLAAGYILQTWGLDGPRATSPARAAFITGLYVVLTPLMQAVLLRRMPRKATILGALIALAGLAVLASGGLSGGLVFGDWLVVACAFAYAAHIIVLGSTDERHDTGALTLIQLTVVGVVCGGLSLAVESAGVPTDGRVWLAIVATGVLASAVAFGVQTWAQRRILPSRVALILVTETAFGGIFGWWAAGTAPLREVVGAGMMMGGMITSEVVAAMAPEAEHVTFEPAVQGMPAPVVEDEHRPARMFE